MQFISMQSSQSESEAEESDNDVSEQTKKMTSVILLGSVQMDVSGTAGKHM
jgi:hypothetical protein